MPFKLSHSLLNEATIWLSLTSKTHITTHRLFQKSLIPSFSPPKAAIFPTTASESVGNSFSRLPKPQRPRFPSFIHTPQASFSESISVEEDSIWSQIREALGYTGQDPGHWNYSPEWWGNDNGGWGRDAGQIVFSKNSEFNQLVEVTTHPASLQGFSSEDLSDSDEVEKRQEWRVLRFNKATRQSVNRVKISSRRSVNEELQQQRWLESGENIEVIADPECLAPEYLKTMASLIASLLGLLQIYQNKEGNFKLRVLCLGVGGGSLPLFLSHHFGAANCMVDGVDIDPVVIEALTVMGVPTNEKHLNFIVEDGIKFLKEQIEQNNQAPYDVICIDVFDGHDNVPDVFCSTEFAEMLNRAIPKERGIILMNFHSDDTEVSKVAQVFHTRLENCTIFSISTQKQYNVTLAAVRGLQLPGDDDGAKKSLTLAGAYVAHEVGYKFPAGQRVCRDFVRYY